MFDRKKRAVGKRRREEERMLAQRSFMFEWIMGRKVNRQISSGEREKKGKGRGNGVENRPPGRRLKVGDAVNAWPTSVGGGWARMEDIAVVLFVFFLDHSKCK